MKMILHAVVLLAAVVLASPAWAEEVDNPEYKQWSKFKAGATARWKMTGTQAGQPMEADISATLKSVEETQAVVTHQVTVSMMGRQMPTPAQDRAIPARIDATQVDPLMGTLDDPQTEKGRETLEVAGRKLDCTWYKIDAGEADTRTTGKLWLCDDVPGQLVKLESKTEGPAPAQQNMVLTEFKAD